MSITYLSGAPQLMGCRSASTLASPNVDVSLRHPDLFSSNHHQSSSRTQSRVLALPDQWHRKSLSRRRCAFVRQTIVSSTRKVVAAGSRRNSKKKSGGKLVKEQDVKGTQARAVRALPIRLLCVAKKSTAPLEALALDYAGKINRYCDFQEVFVRPNPKNSRDPMEQRIAEGERVQKALSPADRVIALDERGKEMTSEALAGLLADAGDRGASSLVFVIGGPFGHGPQVTARADETIRVSKMVLNHQIARLVILEQVYRAWTILRGEPYHH